MPAEQRRFPEVPPGFWFLCVGVFFLGVGIRLVVDASDGAQPPPDGVNASVADAVLDLLTEDRPRPRTAAAYDGLGVWVDAFDFSPSYTSEGRTPVLRPSAVDDFAAVGVRTIYLQASRPDARAPGRVLEEVLLGEWLVRAHAHDIAVVGWYLPTFIDVEADLDRLLAVAEFESRGHRFDGVAVDIEFIEGVTDAGERSRRLVSLSERLREARPREALGGIVPPAVQLEVVNTRYWPGFPWRDIAPLYDVWLPMTYWTTRSVDSGYRDAYTYTEESTRRMRSNLGIDDAVVHPVGGIGDETTAEDLAGFSRALVDLDAVGGSIYDWRSMSAAERAAQEHLVPG